MRASCSSLNDLAGRPPFFESSNSKARSPIANGRHQHAIKAEVEVMRRKMRVSAHHAHSLVPYVDGRVILQAEDTTTLSVK